MTAHQVYPSSPRARPAGRRRLDRVRLRHRRAVVADGPDDAAGRDAVHGARPVARHRRHAARRAGRRAAAWRSWRRAHAQSAGTPRRPTTPSYAPLSRFALAAAHVLRLRAAAGRPRPAVLARHGAVRHDVRVRVPVRADARPPAAAARAAIVVWRWPAASSPRSSSRSCSSSSSTCGCRSPGTDSPMFDGLIAFGHSIWSFCDPLSIGTHPAVVAGRRDHRRAAGPHRDHGRGADDHADDQDAVEPGAAGADLHVRRRDLRRLALGDPAQHPGHAGVGGVVPRRPRAGASRATRAARWASRRPARCWAR